MVDTLISGNNRSTVMKHDLADASQAILSGTTIAEPFTEAVGCYISDLTYWSNCGARQTPLQTVDLPVWWCQSDLPQSTPIFSGDCSLPLSMLYN